MKEVARASAEFRMPGLPMRELELSLSIEQQVYDLICVLHNVGSHFVEYYRFPELENIVE